MDLALELGDSVLDRVLLLDLSVQEGNSGFGLDEFLAVLLNGAFLQFDSELDLIAPGQFELVLLDVCIQGLNVLAQLDDFVLFLFDFFLLTPHFLCLQPDFLRQLIYLLL